MRSITFKNKIWVHENEFLLNCEPQRLSKIISRWELYKKVSDLSGVIIECGVFKGVGLSEWATFRGFLGTHYNKKIIGFDVFDKQPKPTKKYDNFLIDKFIREAGQPYSEQKIMNYLTKKNISENIELVKGDVVKTIPAYVKAHPELKIALINSHIDTYKPCKTIMEYLYPLLVEGGVMVNDNYGVFAGETKAVDEYLKKHKLKPKIKRFPYCFTPSYFIKGEEKARK